MAVKVPQSYGFSSYGGNKFLAVFYKYNDYIRWMQSGELTQSEINSKFTQLQNKDTQLTTKINTVENTVNDIIPSLTKTENGLYFCFGYVATTSSALALIIDCNRAIPSDYVIDTENTKVNTIALRLVNGKYVENNSSYPIPDSDVVSQDFTITGDCKSIRIILTKLNDAVWTDGTNTVTDKTPITGSLRMDLQFKKRESGG